MPMKNISSTDVSWRRMELRQVDLNLLVAFDALMAERSVTKAAHRLLVGQSTMSGTLNRLRKLFGDPIVVREGRGVVATALAESLAGPVRELLEQAEHVLSTRADFDPKTDRRTFRVIANDYLTLTFLRPLLERLAEEAPGVRLHISGTGDDFVTRLREQRVDLMIHPKEVWREYAEFPHASLFRDRYVVAVDQNHPTVKDRISLKQFTTLPYLATSSGSIPSQSEAQLDELGIHRNTEIIAGFGVAPLLLRNTSLVMLIHERLANQISDAAGIKVLDPPVKGLRPITQVMVWTRRTESDPAHRWLRGRIIDLAREIA
jgi:DNA-binding transcriptional LysR family regulator